MNRTDVLNALVRAYGLTAYLEIGVRNPRDNYELVRCHDKTGVDPAVSAPGVERMASDAFFAGLGRRGRGRPRRDFAGAPRRTWGLIFIDGLHQEDQAARDISNALRHLAPGGAVVVHDCNPQSEDAAAPQKPPGGGPWNGTVYRAWLQFRASDRMYVYHAVCVDCDHGCGVIRETAGGGPMQIPGGYSWVDLCLHRTEWLGLVDPARWVAGLPKVL
jgi:hypothetical protein